MTPVVRIPIGDDLFALVDPADYHLIAGRAWRPLRGHNGKIYAYTRGTVYMHRLIARTPRGMETNHANGNGLDNRRANLRIATRSQNKAHIDKPRRPSGDRHSSRFKGVSWDGSRGLWQAKITVEGTCRNLGRYDVEEEAAQAYDVAAAAAWPGFVRLNFPAVAA